MATKPIHCRGEASAGERLADVWRWRSAKGLLVVAGAITVVISLFQVKLDAIAMLREVATNFITCVAITFSIAAIMAIGRMPEAGRSWKRVVLLLVLLAVGGMVGGMISWGINAALFPYRITHPTLYLLTVAVLSIIFGVGVVAYESVSAKLDETAARLAEKEVREQELLRLKTEAELEALRAKVNPHFLFNTLNSIASLIPEDPVKAEDMVQRLSNLFHYVLSTSDTGFVPLEEELGFVEQYLEIEKVRLGGRLDYAIDNDASAGRVAVPGMLLQPLVENSVKHGIAPKKNGGRIDVRCRVEADRCKITIADTGAGFGDEAAGQGFGISGVRRRLELNFPGNHRFDISAGEGVTVEIDIPRVHDVQDSSR